MYNTFNISPKSLTYKTYQDLLLDIKNNINKIPKNFDLVVGVPRSGMIPAYMIGLMFSKQVCSLNEFLSNTINKNITYRISFKNNIKNILIVDDSIYSGRAFENVKKLIKDEKLDEKYNIKYLAIYYRNESYKKIIDSSLVQVPDPRLFQWNYLNHVFLQDAAFDIDGVLCLDPTNEQNDDGEKYRHFLLNADPLFIPQYKIPYIITSRLEKYRPETEEWLKKNNIKYDNLIMLSGYTAAERKKMNVHAKFKADIYKKLNDIQLFIESDKMQAKEISKISGKLCFCSTTDELFGSIK